MSRSDNPRGRRTGQLRSATLLTGVLVAGQLIGIGPAEAATTVPSFTRTDHPSLANHNVVGDFNGDGRPRPRRSGAARRGRHARDR